MKMMCPKYEGDYFQCQAERRRFGNFHHYATLVSNPGGRFISRYRTSNALAVQAIFIHLLTRSHPETG
jgi:hypothetical protein